MINTLLIASFFSFLYYSNDVKHDYLDNQINISINDFVEDYNTYQETHYYEGESVEEIAGKLDKYLKGKLKDKGTYITEYSISVGIDPYLAASVMLLESGCYWGCSKITRECNNVAGNKGTPSCNGTSYKKLDTIEEGMNFSMDVLSNYYKKGLNTPELINPRYAADKNWYKKVNKYIKKLKNA